MDPATGHMYQYVAEPLLSWSQASVAASSLTLNGANGYLATVTSAAEWDFIRSAVFTTAPAGVFIGGSDEDQEGLWKWVTGPEGAISGGFGLPFWSGTYSGTLLNGLFARWKGDG
ncbi:MAG: hypothetical protein M3Q52_10205, partial [Pseudomonadota bacterium]|nr:hypothetical protein [Pseudomonadota bacterium]